ncbi:EYxxD motif small membrane protein [Brevibacillus sp. B_LB10_24]
MGMVGPPIYEWITHNLFVIVLVVAVVAVLIYAFAVGRKKGWYR